ncbi:sugar ABC transporter substrate-binding protein [Kitasatospora sp. NPDC085879]|uniref:sugar ABC transporter substrate-binding protein n=1 Tax=Kitasatospora sp. NPDC085879 TaxID=3154769 RepID=UPI003436C77D
MTTSNPTAPEWPRRLGRRRVRLSAAAAAAALALLAACSGPSADAPPSAANTAAKGADTAGPLTVEVVTHGGTGDSFWSVAQHGATDAGKQLGIQVSYNSDPDPAGQAKLIDNAIAQHIGGLVVSMANPDALQSSIKAAVAAGIPVVTINSGSAASASFGAIGHVGQEESVAGQGAGAKLKKLGRTKVLCVIHEAGNIGLNQRCDGAKQGFGAAVTNLQVDLGNPADTVARIRGALQADPSIDAVLTLNSQVAQSAVTAVAAVGSKAQVATFDLNKDVLAAIKAGTVVFAVDQQQYEQGYIAVVMLKLFHDNGNTLGGGMPVLTGPGFVDKSNVDQVTRFADRGTR